MNMPIRLWSKTRGRRPPLFRRMGTNEYDIKKPLNLLSGYSALWRTDISMKEPGQAIPTEGFHDESVDVMNTSFSLMRHKVRKEKVFFGHGLVNYEKKNLIELAFPGIMIMKL